MPDFSPFVVGQGYFGSRARAGVEEGWRRILGCRIVKGNNDDNQPLSHSGTHSNSNTKTETKTVIKTQDRKTETETKRASEESRENNEIPHAHFYHAPKKEKH